MKKEEAYSQIEAALNGAFLTKDAFAPSSLSPLLLYNDKENNKKIIDAIRYELSKCLSFSFSVAFISRSGYQLLKGALKEAKDKRINGKILTTDYLSFTDPDVLEEIEREFPNIEVRLFKTLDSSLDGFHTKAYIFEEKCAGSQIFKAIIGSSNITANALTTNKEWNTSLVSLKSGSFINDVLREFNALWEKGTTLDSYLDTYRKIFNEQKRLKKALENKEISEEKLIPNKMQIRFVNNWEESIKKGQKRGLLISATGTGKTFASAFGVSVIKPKKVLFLAHRSLLLRQAATSYRRVLGKKVKFAIFSGDNKNSDIASGLEPFSFDNKENIDILFSTCEMLGKKENFERFDPSFFDLIIIDEVHRAGSTTYQKILSYFKPSYVLGMTATPERTEDASLVFSLFDHNILAEIRLKDALEESLLCPFHYYGITDIKGINDEIYKKKDFAKLYSEERLNYILKQSAFYGYSGSRLKGLIFVSSIEDGLALEKGLNKKGKKSVFLSGKNSSIEREKQIELLEKEDISDGNYLDFIITVDIFNEGVDIPSINQVILLRPTISSIIFIQQLGRGLRKYQDKDFVVIIDFIGNYENNFMIPKAFSYEGDKEAARSVLVNGGHLPGISTIEFDEIAKERIYKSISEASFSSFRETKNVVLRLAEKLNRLPTYQDYYDYTDFDPKRFFNETKAGSYLGFLNKIQKSLPSFINLPLFTDEEYDYFRALGASLGLGIRVEEPLLLKEIIEGGNYFSFLDKLNNIYHKSIDKNKEITLLNILKGEWSSSGKFVKYPFLSDFNTLSPDFRNHLFTNKEFLYEVLSFLTFLLKRNEIFYQKSYKDTDFTIFEKYSKKDISQLLNNQKDLTAVFFGYKYDKNTKTFPIFINYDKAPDLEESTNYRDHFLNPKIFSWESRKDKHLSDKELSFIFNKEKEGTRLYLFIRKDNSDKDKSPYYFLGEMSQIGQAKEVKRKVENKEYSYVDIDFLLEEEVRSDIYDYLTSNIKE